MEEYKATNSPYAYKSANSPSVPPNAAPPTQNSANASQDGGPAAWLQVLGCFFCWFNSWGLTNAFGVFQEYYETNLLQSSSPSQISWIGSISSFLLIFFGVLTGPAYDAGYFRVLLWSGTFLVVFGYMMTSLCTQYWEVVLAQGIVVGLGSGCLFVPSVSVLPQYFRKHASLANGIAASGSSFGGVIYPIIFRRLLPQVGFGWSVRILGFIALGTLSISLALMKVRRKPGKRRLLFDMAAFQEPPFAIFTFGAIFMIAAVYVPPFYIESFAVQNGITNANLATYMLPILNAGGVAGRIIPNFLADKTGPLNIMAPFVTMSGVMILIWIAVVNTGGLIVFALIYGFFSGAILALPPMAVASMTPSLEVLGARMGTAFAVASVGLLIGTPVSGAIVRNSGSYLGAQIFAGVLFLICGAFCTVCRIAKTGFRLAVRA